MLRLAVLMILLAAVPFSCASPYDPPIDGKNLTVPNPVRAGPTLTISVLPEGIERWQVTADSCWVSGVILLNGRPVDQFDAGCKTGWDYTWTVPILENRTSTYFHVRLVYYAVPSMKRHELNFNFSRPIIDQ